MDASTPPSPLITTVLLNWNRGYLLEQTLESYVATVSVPYKLLIIDNGSSDNSGEVIRRFVEKHPATEVISLPENIGGEAYNLAIPKIEGEFLHISENDKIYLHGWCEKMVHAFTSFPKLGQLCLESPVPTDAEAWVSKQVTTLRFHNGCLLYQPERNVITSSIIRKEIFTRGLKVHNIVRQDSHVKFPDDSRLSIDVKKMGYWVANCDHSYVRNIGHEASEIKNNPDYYQANYKAKPAVGLQGLQDRLATQDKLQTVERKSFALPEERLSAELTDVRVNHVEGRFWSMFDSRTPEVESVDIIASMVRLTKPQNVLETGGWLGHVSLAVGRALQANGLGALVTLEHNKEAYAYLEQRIRDSGLGTISVRRERSERFVPKRQFDLVIFNSDVEDPEEEFYHLLPHLKDGAQLIFTGTRADNALDRLPHRLETMGVLSGQFFATPRGLYIGQYKKPAKQEKRLVFCLSPGRSGTAYLTWLIKGLDGVVSLHEPEPKYQWETSNLQKDLRLAYEFVRNKKLPAIGRIPGQLYFEASHYIEKGFLEAWGNTDVTPDFITLKRDPRKIALSWYALGADFHTDTAFVYQHMLHPEDKRPLFLPLKDWKSLNDYQLCYWYALESEKRAAHYAHLLAKRGAKFFETSVEQLASGEHILPLLQWLDIEPLEEELKVLKQRAQNRVNDKSVHKNKARLQAIKTLDLDALEEACRAQLP